jgi:hypothetical protein
MEKFVERTKEELGIRGRGRKIGAMEGQFELRESEAPYNGHFEAKKGDIMPENAYVCKDFPRMLRCYSLTPNSKKVPPWENQFLFILNIIDNVLLFYSPRE